MMVKCCIRYDKVSESAINILIHCMQIFVKHRPAVVASAKSADFSLSTSIDL